MVRAVSCAGHKLEGMSASTQQKDGSCPERSVCSALGSMQGACRGRLAGRAHSRYAQCCFLLATLSARTCRPSFTVVTIAMYCADDQAETVLLRLSRASGIDGLAGMAACSSLNIAGPCRSPTVPHSPTPVPDGGSSNCIQMPAGTSGQGSTRLLRPLLWASKAELQALLNEAGVSWLEDSTNADTSFTRNYIRHLPGMQPLCAEDPQHCTQQHSAGHLPKKQTRQLRSCSSPVTPSASCGQGSAQTADGISADLLRLAAVCADASQTWTEAAADLLKACVRPLPSTNGETSAEGCSLDLVQLSQAPWPVAHRAMSAAMQVRRI